MADILVTGFGPFPGMPGNPSGQIVMRLARQRRPALSQAALATHLFATSYAAVDRDLPKLLAQHRPKILIMFGVAGRTAFMRVETLARNRQSVLHPDCARHTPAALNIRLGAAGHRPGRAPFVRLRHAGQTTGIDVRLSRDAGTYICNYVYWRALEAAGKGHSPDIVVFIHVPKLRSRRQIKLSAHLPTLDRLVRASEAILIAAKACSPSR